MTKCVELVLTEQERRRVEDRSLRSRREVPRMTMRCAVSQEEPSQSVERSAGRDVLQGLGRVQCGSV